MEALDLQGMQQNTLATLNRRVEGGVVYPTAFLPRPAGWLEQVISELADLVHLMPGWDTYDACCIERGSIIRAVAFMRENAENTELLRPRVVPTSSGTIQLDWSTDDVGAALEFAGDKWSLYVDVGGVETETDDPSDLTPLTDALRQIASAP
jgi:hypothetical protein